MKWRRIVRYPDKSLREVTQEVALEEKSLRALEEDLIRSLESEETGVALAANQIGRTERAFVVKRGSVDSSSEELVKNIPTLVVNPHIVESSDDVAFDEEGCLSFPGMTFLVPRRKWIIVEYDCIEKNGQTSHRKERHEGFWARVFQHEIEHLDGKTFIDFLPYGKRLKIAADMRRRKGPF